MSANVLDTIAIYPYHQVPDERDAEQMEAAFLDCFNTPAGHIVLNRFYWGEVMRQTPYGEAGQRQLGKIELFHFIIDMMQKGETARRAKQWRGKVF